MNCRLLVAALALMLAPGAGLSDVPDRLKPLGAYTHWYPDTVDLRPDDPQRDGEWRDVIGEDIFDTKGIAAGWADGRLHLALVSNFPDANVDSAGRLVAPADLALDLDRDGVLETGIVLSAIRATGDRGIVRATNIRQGAAYTVSKWHYPSDILRATYGQGWRWSGPGGEPRQQSAIPVWIAEGVERDDLDVSVSWRRVPGSRAHAVLITLSYPEKPAALHNVPVVWGTAVCGNDVVFAPVSRLGDLEGPVPVIGKVPDLGSAGPRWDGGAVLSGGAVAGGGLAGQPRGSKENPGGGDVTNSVALVNLVLNPEGTSGSLPPETGDGTAGSSDAEDSGPGVTAVPLPPAALMFGAALAGLGWLSWRSRRRRR